VPLAIWILGKFFAYCAMALLATRMFGFGRDDRFGFTGRYAGLRLVIGIIAGFFIVYVWTQLPDAWSEVTNYILTFGVFRYFEWLLVLFVMTRYARTSVLRLGWKGQAWLLLGVAVNIALDQVAVHSAFANTRFYC
jgi:hypothetical protein